MKLRGYTKVQKVMFLKLIVILVICVPQGLMGRVAAETEQNILATKLSPDNTKIAVSGTNGLLQVWDATTGQMILNIPGLTGLIRSVDWNPDGSKIVSGGEQIKIWEVSTGTLILTLAGHGERVNYVDWNPDGSKIVSGATENPPGVKIWDATTGTLLNSLEASDVFQLKWNPNGDTVAVGTFGAGLFNYNPAYNHYGLEILSHRLGGQDTIFSVGWNSSGNLLAVYSIQEKIFVWDINARVIILTIEGVQGRVSDLAWSPNNLYIAGASNNGLLYIWDASSGNLINSISHGDNTLSVIDWSQNGDKIIYGNGSTPQISDIMLTPTPP